MAQICRRDGGLSLSQPKAANYADMILSAQPQMRAASSCKAIRFSRRTAAQAVLRLPCAVTAKANTPFDTPVGDVRHAGSIQPTVTTEVDIAIMAV